MAGMNTLVRFHSHSSVRNTEDDGFLMRSLFTAFQIDLDTRASRAVRDYDYVFTFLLTNKLEGHDIDLTITSSSHTPIYDDKNCAKLMWKLAGGAVCDMCELWVERVDLALSDKTQTAGVKKQISKNYNDAGGKLCDLAVSVLNG